MWFMCGGHPVPRFHGVRRGQRPGAVVAEDGARDGPELLSTRSFALSNSSSVRSPRARISDSRASSSTLLRRSPPPCAVSRRQVSKACRVFVYVIARGRDMGRRETARARAPHTLRTPLDGEARLGPPA
jgi:hypothetical protein